MKKLLLIVLLAALAIVSPAQSLGTAHTISVSWEAPPANQTGLTLIGYTLTITPPTGVTGGNVVINNCPTGVTTNCIAGATATSVNFTPDPGPLYLGTWGFSLVANYTNSANATVSSAPATASVLYALAPVTVGAAPGGLTVQFQ
jgi:hypothetical protein